MIPKLFPLLVALLTLTVMHATEPSADDGQLHLTLRSRAKVSPEAGYPASTEAKRVDWKCQEDRHDHLCDDMWDDHWCKSASQRVTELAGPMNEMLKQARAKGVFIIHAPSSVTGYYKGTPQRARAQAAPFARTPIPLVVDERWGTKWAWPDSRHEGVLPIDDSDMGCSCAGTKCTIREAWTRENPVLEIAEHAGCHHGQRTGDLESAHRAGH